MRSILNKLIDLLTPSSNFIRLALSIMLVNSKEILVIIIKLNIKLFGFIKAIANILIASELVNRNTTGNMEGVQQQQSDVQNEVIREPDTMYT